MSLGRRCPDCEHFLDVHGPDGCTVVLTVETAHDGSESVGVWCRCTRQGLQLALEVSQ